MSLFPTNRRKRVRAGGFTLLEIVVTLVLLGLAAALVAPTFRMERAPDENLDVVLAVARESAVRRAQTLLLRVDTRGDWQITAAGDSSSVGTGHLSDGTRDLRIRVNPLGACFNEGVPAPSPGAVALDAVGCRVPRTSGGR